jgi:hypothetical protein
MLKGKFSEGIPLIGTIPKLKFPDRPVADITLLQVGQSDSFSILRFKKDPLKILLGKRVEIEKTLFFADQLELFGSLNLLLNIDIIFPGKISQGFRVGIVFVFHQEVDRISRFPATETFVDTLYGRYGKRGCFFIVKRTKTNEVDTPPAQGHKLSDNLLNPGGTYNVINSFVRNHNQALSNS